MWSQISKRVVSLLKVGFFAMISFVTFVLFLVVSISAFFLLEEEGFSAYPFS